MSHTPLGQSDAVYISCLSILVFVEDCGNQALSPLINRGDHSRPNIGVAGECEVERLTEDGEVEADGEMELDETEGIGEETGYLEAREEGVIAL